MSPEATMTLASPRSRKNKFKILSSWEHRDLAIGPSHMIHYLEYAGGRCLQTTSEECAGAPLCMNYILTGSIETNFHREKAIQIHRDFYLSASHGVGGMMVEN
ncbi:hypothetical protein TNCV_3821471 [Trichonephila clavipes]|nr:hypothetical protein TNCV_3821471 [Trichonephila clavipes]